jgi:DNA polymerase/3'-5' exonuclease PolX
MSTFYKQQNTILEPSQSNTVTSPIFSFSIFQPKQEGLQTITSTAPITTNANIISTATSFNKNNSLQSLFSPIERSQSQKLFIQSRSPVSFNPVQILSNENQIILPVTRSSEVPPLLQQPVFNIQPVFNVQPIFNVQQQQPLFNLQQQLQPIEKSMTIVGNSDWSSPKYIADIFQQLVEQLVTEGQGYRANALNNSSQIISKLKVPITSEQQLKNLPGVGKGTLDRVREIIQTGTLREINVMSEEDLKKKEILENFMRVHGVGKETAKEWYAKGFRSLDRVYAAGIATQAQMASMRYLKEIELKIPREEITQIKDKIQQVVNEFNTAYGVKIYMEIAGSYRRLKPVCGDIDILMKEETGHQVSQYMSTLIEELKRRGIILETLAFGPIKYMGIGRLDENHPAHRIDIEMVDDLSSWYPALVYFTGSKENNTLMRQRALDLQFEGLNEKGLFDKNGQKVSINSEEELYYVLQLPYLKPEQR